jgi:hypothetical protein
MKKNFDQIPTLISSIRQISGENDTIIYVPTFANHLVDEDKVVRSVAWGGVGDMYPKFLIPVAELVQKEYLNENNEPDFGKLAALQSDATAYADCTNQQLINISGAVFKGLNAEFDLGENTIDEASSDDDFNLAAQMYFEQVFNAYAPQAIEVEEIETVAEQASNTVEVEENLPAVVESSLPVTPSEGFVKFLQLYTNNQSELLNQVGDMLAIAAKLVKSQADNAEKFNEALKTMIPAEVREKV